MNVSDPFDTIITVGLIIMVTMTVGAGLLKLFLAWKEKREAAREDAREDELWK